MLGCLSVFNLLTAERAIFKRCSLPVLHSNTNTETSSPPVEPCKKIFRIIRIQFSNRQYQI